MHGREGLSAWMTRAGFSAQPVRWFCGPDGSVVVEQMARWVDPVTGAPRGAALVASQFLVDGGSIARYARHDDLGLALDAAHLDVGDEVTPGAPTP